MVGIGRTLREGCTTCGQEHPEEPIVIFSSAIIALKTLDVVLSRIHFWLVGQVGGDACLVFHIR